MLGKRLALRARAALVKEADPALTPAEMRAVLTITARDIEAVGIDRDSGAGLVDALAAVQAALENEPPPDTCQTCLSTAGLVVGTVLTGPGTTITVPVEARHAPDAIGALGFEVTFDPTLLQFTGSTTGALTANQHFIIGAALVEPGRIRVGGFTRQNDIADGSSDQLVDLHFDVLACQQDQAFPLTLDRLVDDVATWDTCAGCVTCSCLPDGDVNQDGPLTPADALLAFHTFWTSSTSPWIPASRPTPMYTTRWAVTSPPATHCASSGSSWGCRPAWISGSLFREFMFALRSNAVIIGFGCSIALGTDIPL
jgi:hypothetical protein